MRKRAAAAVIDSSALLCVALGEPAAEVGLRPISYALRAAFRSATVVISVIGSMGEGSRPRPR